MRLAIIDGYAACRQGLAAALRDAGYEAEEHSALMDAMATLHEGVAVVVVRRPSDLDELQAAKIANPQVVIAVVQEDSGPRALRASLVAGASVVMPADTSIDELVHGIKLACSGNTIIPTSSLWELVCGAGIDIEECGVSAHEQEWIRTLARGATVYQLARKVGYSEREMYRSLHDVYERLGARNRAEALVRAARLGLVD